LGPEGVAAFLRRHRRLGLESSVFIYQFEGNPRYTGLTRPVFRDLAGDRVRAMTSVITITEILVPTWKLDDPELRDQILNRVMNFPNIDWIAADTRISDVAALYRARYRLRTPDAIQAATATVSGATGFVTNDRVFTRIPSFETLILEDLV